MSYVLAIDYGTSYTCAAIRVDGRTELLRLGGQDTHLLSNVFLEDDGKTLTVGRVAYNSAARAPERYERSPKRELGFGILALGDTPCDPRDAAAAVFAEVLEAARRHENGREPSEVRLTHPAAWGSKRKDALTAAGERAGIRRALLVSEPEAAVHHFAHSPRVEIGTGDLIAVYDLGGGTFDTAVLHCTGRDSYELAAPPGGTAGREDGAPEIGGDVFDRRVYEYFGRQIASHDEQVWEAIRRPQTQRDRHARRHLREDAREAKETLSSGLEAPVYVDRVGMDLLITRPKFAEMIAGEIGESLEILASTLVAAGVRPNELAALFLTGGSSRIPHVYDSVRGRFGRADAQDDPKAVVALGAARMEPGRPAPAPVSKPVPAVKKKPAAAKKKPAAAVKPPPPKPVAPQPQPQPQPTPTPTPTPTADVPAPASGKLALAILLAVAAVACAAAAAYAGLAHVITGPQKSNAGSLGDFDFDNSSSLGDIGLWFLWLWGTGACGYLAIGAARLASEQYTAWDDTNKQRREAGR